MLSFSGFLLLAMRSSLVRKLEEVDGEVSEQDRVKYLRIDKNPDRYAMRAISRYVTRSRVASPRPLERDGATSRLQKWWRSVARYSKLINNTESTGTKGKIRAGGKDVICPITQDTITVDGCFKIVLDNGSVVVYTLEDLVSYISNTGVFQCCLTRQPIYLPTIRRLTKSAKNKNIDGWHDIMTKYFARAQIRRDRIEHDNRILAIEASCAAVMTDILDAAANHDSGSMRASLSVLEFSREWLQLIQTYSRLDATSCLSMLAGDRERIRRLRGTAHADPYYLLASLDQDVVVPSLTTCQRITSYPSRPPPLPPTQRFTPSPILEGLDLSDMGNLPSISSLANSSRWPVYSPRTGVFGSRVSQTIHPVRSPVRSPVFATVAESILGSSVEANTRSWRSINAGSSNWRVDIEGNLRFAPAFGLDEDEMSISSGSSQTGSLDSVAGGFDTS